MNVIKRIFCKPAPATSDSKFYISDAAAQRTAAWWVNQGSTEAAADREISNRAVAKRQA